MVNFIAAVYKPLLCWLMKMAGITPYVVEIEPGTTVNIWVPSETIRKPARSKKTTGSTPEIIKPTKPVVVLLHGFAADGIFTWQFQVGSLTKDYAIYVPDLLFFGRSITDNPRRSPALQAEYLVKGLRKLGIERCTVVGFSYGGMVAFKMVEMYPDLVEAVVVSGSVLEMTDSICEPMLGELGYSSLPEFLLPTSVKACKALLNIAMHKRLWIPNRLYQDFLEVMFNNTMEKVELLEGMVVATKVTVTPNFHQRIHLLWGENDQILKLELAQNLKEQLGDKATLQVIRKAGHLVHLERPFIYNRYLKQFLISLNADEARDEDDYIASN